MRMAFYEDRAAVQFTPIALMRPVFELRCGRFSLRERLLRRQDVSAWGAVMRPYLAETFQEAHPEAHVNDLLWLQEEATLLINGRWLPAALPELGDDEVAVLDGTPVCFTLHPEEAGLLNLDDWGVLLARIVHSRRRVEARGRLLHYPWDLLEANPSQLAADFVDHAGEPPRSEQGNQVSILGDANRVSIAASARIEPFVVLDATAGPISIDDGAVIHSFTKLEGPSHIGGESRLFRALIREGTTVGPECRVGGEVEASILHGYVNKYHEGFLGHSYVCPWVNLGALTTGSDLKNDYSEARVPLAGELLATGMTKVGSFLGDHAKTGLCSLFNTGSSVGVMSQILPAGELLPKNVPSFACIWHGNLEEGWNLDRHLQTARVVMGRRNHELTPAAERLLRFLFEQTRTERESAIARFAEKNRQRSLQKTG